MKIKIKSGILGIKLSLDDGEQGPPKRAANVSQIKPRDSYIYGHLSPSGDIFYIGRGKARRAWSKDRHLVWERYVSERCNGSYTVEILVDNLSETEAEEVEAEWIDYYGPQLVNWVNAGRDVDLEALTTFHQLRDANRKFVDETRSMEKTAPDEAIRRYRQALVKLEEYEGLTLERGLVAELCESIKYGDPNILDRLTICLTSVGRQQESKEAAEKYFGSFPDARKSSIGQRIIKRVNRVVRQTR